MSRLKYYPIQYYCSVAGMIKIQILCLSLKFRSPNLL
jgi:hypothetical protein